MGRLLENKKVKMDSAADKKKKFVETTALIPTRVVRVNVDGIGITKDEVVTNLVSELFSVKVNRFRLLSFIALICNSFFRLTLNL